MKTLFSTFVILAIFASCQRTELVEFIESNNDSKLVLRRMSFDKLQDKDPLSEERYLYDANGVLLKKEQWLSNPKQEFFLMRYDGYSYENQKLIKVVTYYRNNEMDWKPAYEQEHIYDNETLVETKNFTYITEGKKLKNRILFTYKNGLKTEEKQLNGSDKLTQRSEFTYKDGKMTTEKCYSADSKLFLFFEHTYQNEKLFQIAEYYSSPLQRASLHEFLYDSRGRLAAEIARESSLLLCGPMPAIVRYAY